MMKTEAQDLVWQDGELRTSARGGGAERLNLAPLPPSPHPHSSWAAPVWPSGHQANATSGGVASLWLGWSELET